MLLSKKTNKFYIGQTQDLTKRLEKHNKGYNKSTKSGIPWILFAYCTRPTRSEAMKTERKMKNLKSHKNLSAIIQNSEHWVQVPSRQ